MANTYFKKTGVYRTITNRNGVPFRFEILGDSHGVLVLDDEKDKDNIEDLLKFQAASKAGVQKIDAQIYEDLKKNLPLPPPKQEFSIRLINQNALNDTLAPIPARPVMAPGAARPVAALNRAIPAKVPVTPEDIQVTMLGAEAPSNAPAPAPAGKKIRLGPAKPKVAAKTPEG